MQGGAHSTLVSLGITLTVLATPSPTGNSLVGPTVMSMEVPLYRAVELTVGHGQLTQFSVPLFLPESPE